MLQAIHQGIRLFCIVPQLLNMVANKLYGSMVAWHAADSLIVYIQIGLREVKTPMCEEVFHPY